MDDFWIRHYDIPRDAPCEGWARVVLSSDGFFATVSDWGNYAFWWGSPGMEFRRFVIRLVESPDYVIGKLSPRPWEYDGDESCKSIKRAILDLRRHGGLTADQAREEWALLEEHEDVDGIAAFTRWHDETTLGDAHEHYCTSPPGQLVAFCKRILPRLAEMLKKELEAEEP